MLEISIMPLVLNIGLPVLLICLLANFKLKLIMDKNKYPNRIELQSTKLIKLCDIGITIGWIWLVIAMILPAWGIFSLMKSY
jgi:hypothetical protein